MEGFVTDRRLAHLLRTNFVVKASTCLMDKHHAIPKKLYGYNMAIYIYICFVIILLDLFSLWFGLNPSETARLLRQAFTIAYLRMLMVPHLQKGDMSDSVRLCLPSLCTYVVLHFDGIQADTSSARFDLVVPYEVQWQRLQLISLMSWTPCKRHM